MLLIGIQVLTLVALIIDIYLASVSLQNGAVLGCGPDSNCHTVLSSRWAYWFGAPVSTFAWVVYAALLGATFGLRPDKPLGQQRRSWVIAWTCAFLIIGAALWFAIVQLFILKAICPYCMTAHVSAAGGALLLLLNAPLPPPKKRSRNVDHELVFPQGMARKLAGLSLAGVVVLILGQLAYKPKTFVTHNVTVATTTNAIVKTERELQLFDGRFHLNLAQVPLIGRQDAPHVMVSLFDYTCHLCREMHRPIADAYRQFSNNLAIVNLPMPLDGKCNPVMKQTPPAHTNACELARIGLTVWRANPNRSEQFDEWVFAPMHPPLPAEVERYARHLVGPEAYDKAAADPWVSTQLRQDIALFEMSVKEFRKGYMPQVIIGTNLVSGTFSRDQLRRALADQFGLMSP